MLCPSHDLRAPVLLWDPMLSMNKVELDPILNVDLHLYFEKLMRGRVSYISKRYSQADRKCLKSNVPKNLTKHKGWI